jgi:hypothetical protein
MLDFEGTKTKSTDLKAAWILLDACTVLKLASSGISSISGCTLGMKLEQPTLGDQIRRTKEHMKSGHVLGQSAIVRPLVSKNVLDDVKRMLNLRSNTGLKPLELLAQPSDGDTLNDQIEQATILMQETGEKPSTAVVGLGYRGLDRDNSGLTIIHRGKTKSLGGPERKLIKRRNAVEPDIGHLKGGIGSRLHALLFAKGYNLRWLLRAIARKGLRAFSRACRQSSCGQSGGTWPNHSYESVPHKLMK